MKKLKKPTKAVKKPARKGRPLPDVPAKTEAKIKKIAKTPGTYLIRANEVRRAAEVDYITDPEARSLDHWHSRKDRPYSRMVGIKSFRVWCQEDEWVKRREQFWAEITERIIQERQKQVMRAGLIELEELTEVRMYMGEYLQPKRDAAGNVMRYTDGEFEGLPIMPLSMPSVEKFVKMFLELEKHLMLKRGEAITRSDSMDDETRVKVRSLDPIAAKTSITRTDVRAMAQLLLERRQPELVGDGSFIESETAEEEDNGEDKL